MAANVLEVVIEAKASIIERQLGPIKTRVYRTRTALLERSASITPVGIFDYLCEEHSDSFSPSHRRTLERRVRQWSLLHGENKRSSSVRKRSLTNKGSWNLHGPTSS